GSAAAVVAGFMWANFTLDTGGEHTGATIEWERTFRLIPCLPDLRALHSLPRAAVLLVLVGLASRGLGWISSRVLAERWWWVERLIVWAPRWAALLVVASWVTPAPWVEAYPWSKVALAATMLLSWVALEGTARSGGSAQINLAL